MAKDLVALMAGLGFERFRVASHDRGARVAHRLALDHPERVERLCTMDIIPTLEHFERADMAFAMGYYHWFWLAQPHDRPERMILRDVEDWFDMHTSREPKDLGFFHPEARADYLAALREPGTVASICEDYRAAATIDLEHDRASRAAGRESSRARCWRLGREGLVQQVVRRPRHLAQLRRRRGDGWRRHSGHYLAEEAPEEVLAWLNRFL